MRTLIASSLAFGALVMFACGGDYGSDDPVAPDAGGASSGNATSSSGDGGPTNNEGGAPGKPITVTGKVVSFGVALPNIPVVVAGKTPVNTSALGTFTVTDVVPPYDVAFALKTSDAQPRVTIYEGLTRPDPTLVALGLNGELRPNPVAATSMTGKVTGGGGPPFGNVPILAFGAPNRAFGFAAADPTAGTYTMQGAGGPLWYGAASVTGSLHASLVLPGAPATGPTAFYGRLDNVTVTAGQAAADKNVTLGPVPVGILQAKITAPARYTDGSKTGVNMGIRYQEQAGYFVKITGQAFPLDMKQPVPLVNGSAYQVNVGYAVGGDGEASFARATTPAVASGVVTLAVAEPPAQTAPADGATGVSLSTPFTFSAFPNGINRFAIGAANQPSITIVTGGTSAKVPDLSPFAITLPGGVEYTWRVAGIRPVSSIDADELPIFVASIDGSLPNVDQCEVAISPARKVTLAAP